MTFQIAPFETIAAEFVDSARPIAIIVAPNFESRSVGACRALVEQLVDKGIQPTRVHWFVLTLQGDNPPEILDALKAVHTRAVLRVLQDAGYEHERVIQCTIRYPVEPDRFAAQMAEMFRSISSEAELIVDFSAMPRNLLSNFLRQVSVSARYETPFPTVKRVWLIYTWAAAYPEYAGPEIVGGIVGHFSHMRLHSLLEKRTHAEIILFTSGSGHDASEVLEAVRDTALGNQIGIQLVNFMNSENFHESYRHLRNHYGLIREAQRVGTTSVRYVFSIRHALQFMRERAQICAKMRNSGNATLFAIAPFGPKPLAVAAHFVRQEYLASIHGRTLVESDVLNSKGTQYLSPYSLGSRSCMSFRYDPAEIHFE